jgi:hypothetical protein
MRAGFPGNHAVHGSRKVYDKPPPHPPGGLYFRILRVEATLTAIW